MNDTAKPLVEDRSKEKKKTVLKKNARLSTFNKADGKKDSIMLPIEGITEEVEINSALDPKDNLNADDLKSVTSVAASNNATHRPLNPLADLDSSPMDKKDIAKKAKMRMSLAGTKVKGVNKFARKGTTIINPGMEESLGEKKDGEDSNGIPGMGTDQLMMIEDDDELIDL